MVHSAQFLSLNLFSIHAEIEKVVDDACSRTRTSRNARKRTQTSVDTIFDERDFAPVDGEVVTVVEPAEDDTGLRRSKRTKKSYCARLKIEQGVRIEVLNIVCEQLLVLEQAWKSL